MPAEKETHLKEVLVKLMAMPMFSFEASFEIETKNPSIICLSFIINSFICSSWLSKIGC